MIPGITASGRQASNDRTEQITLTNPGAEAGSTTGWTNEVGSLATRTTNPAPHTGSFYFAGGANASTRARQRIELMAATTFTAAEIDSGDMLAKVTWWQAGFTAPDTDHGAMGLRFLDAGQVQISQSIAASIDQLPDLTWAQREHEVAIPANTRYIDVLYSATRTTGTNLDVYVDDVSLQAQLDTT